MNTECFNNVVIVTANKELSDRMNLIRDEYNGVLKSANKIGKALSEIRNGKLWEGTYNSFEECVGVFGIKKAQAYNLIKGYEVGEKKLLRDKNDPRKATKLCNAFSNTQCVELAKLKEDVKILDMVDSEKITPDMTTKEIRDIVDRELHPEKYVEKEPETEEVEEVTEESKDDVVLEVKKVDGVLCVVAKGFEIAAKDVEKIRMIVGKYVG